MAAFENRDRPVRVGRECSPSRNAIGLQRQSALLVLRTTSPVASHDKNYDNGVFPGRAMARKKLTSEIIDGGTVLALRTQLGLNQSEFWQPLGVTQSGGSRYEGERGMPSAVKLLVLLAYGSELEAHQLLTRLRAHTPASQGSLGKANMPSPFPQPRPRRRINAIR